jgi:hypothetical protein
MQLHFFVRRKSVVAVRANAPHICSANSGIITTNATNTAAKINWGRKRGFRLVITRVVRSITFEILSDYIVSQSIAMGRKWALITATNLSSP